MARIIKNPLFGDISGSVGGVVFQNGPSGPMLRIKADSKPTATARLQQTQQTLQAAMNAYNSLSDIGRVYWGSLATAYNTQRQSQSQAILAGRNAFIRYYTLATFAGLSNPPLLPEKDPWFPMHAALVSGYDFDMENYSLLELTTPLKLSTWRVQFKPADMYPLYNAREKWRTIYIYGETYTYWTEWNYNSTTGLWSLTLYFDHNGLKPYARPGKYRQIQVRVIGATTDGLISDFQNGYGELQPPPWPDQPYP